MTIDSTTQTLVQSLATFASGTEIDAAPEEARTQAKLCLLDTIGCIIAGAETPEARVLFEAEMALNGRPEDWKEDTVARVFGYLGDTLELNDLIGGHSSIGIVTALIAKTMVRDVAGTDLIRAIIAGTETTARVYDSVVGRLKPYTETAIVVPSYFNAFGAAAACGIVEGLEEEQLAHALAISSTLNSWAPAEVIFGDGGTVKPMLFGANPASIAIQSVGYAAAGMTGPQTIIESPIGLMAGIAKEFNPRAMRENENWFITIPQRKLQAACGYTHSAIDAVNTMKLTREQAQSVTAIRIAIPEFYISAVGKSGAPVSSNDARFHIGYLVALALQGEYPILPKHTIEFDEFFRDELTSRLSNIVQIIPLGDDEINSTKPYNVSRVEVELSTGEVFTASCSAPKGSAENPLSDDEVIDKFHRLVAPQLSAEGAEEMLQSVMNVDSADDVSPLMRRVFATVTKPFG